MEIAISGSLWREPCEGAYREREKVENPGKEPREGALGIRPRERAYSEGTWGGILQRNPMKVA